ncbi:MAG: mechanosensitive ion channel family protein [Nitriliruptor sp.]|nr:MAG: mechanosensitive ion channel family protein [Nitriliruptor sp.]
MVGNVVCCVTPGRSMKRRSMNSYPSLSIRARTSCAVCGELPNFSLLVVAVPTARRCRRRAREQEGWWGVARDVVQVLSLAGGRGARNRRSLSRRSTSGHGWGSAGRPARPWRAHLAPTSVLHDRTLRAGGSPRFSRVFPARYAAAGARNAADGGTASLRVVTTPAGRGRRMQMLFAVEETEEPTIEIVEPARPVTEFIERQFGDGPLVTLIAGSIDVIAQVALIFVLTTIVLLLVKRLIRRATAAAAEPKTPGLGRRRSLGEHGRKHAPVSVRRAQRAEALGALANSVLSVLIWTMAVLILLSTAFGISLTPLLAGAGIFGVAIGFGAQGLVGDFLAGIFMLAEDQYGVGDIVDVGDASGVVEGVSLRTTRVRDISGTLWHVPNGQIMRVGNMSQEWARALLDIGVAYGTDIDAASELILTIAVDMANEDDYQEIFLDEPEIWGVENLGTDSVDIRLVIKTQPGQQYAIARELRRRIKNAFDAAAVEIPFPQRTVWLRTEQPVSLGGEQAPAFDHPVTDAAMVERARTAARRGDTSPPPVDFAEVEVEAVEGLEDGE